MERLFVRGEGHVLADLPQFEAVSPQRSGEIEPPQSVHVGVRVIGPLWRDTPISILAVSGFSLEERDFDRASFRISWQEYETGCIRHGVLHFVLVNRASGDVEHLRAPASGGSLVEL